MDAGVRRRRHEAALLHAYCCHLGGTPPSLAWKLPVGAASGPCALLTRPLPALPAPRGHPPQAVVREGEQYMDHPVHLGGEAFVLAELKVTPPVEKKQPGRWVLFVDEHCVFHCGGWAARCSCAADAPGLG